MMNKLFMAFAKGTESTNEVVFNKYIGVAPISILGVNSNKVELEKLYGRTLTNDPEYTSTTNVTTANVTAVKKQARIDFIVQTDADRCNGIDLISKVSFYIVESARYTRSGEKLQVIDKYNQTAWITPTELKNKTLPINITWVDVASMRPAFIGEEDLTQFIRTYCGIPGLAYKDQKTGQIVTRDNPADAEGRMDKLNNCFNGDFTEIKNLIASRPNNKIKVLFGVKTTDNNKQYQDVFIRKFANNRVGVDASTNLYTAINKELIKAKENGAYPKTEFEACPLKIYSVKATTFAATDNAEAFGGGIETADDDKLDLPF